MPSSPVVSFFPQVGSLKIDPNHVRIWKIEYQYKDALAVWRPGKPFVLPRPAGKPIEGIAVIMAAAAHADCLGIELTACRLHTPITAVAS